MRYFIEARSDHPTAELIEDEDGDIWRQVEDDELECPNCEAMGGSQWERVRDNERRCEDCIDEI